MAGVTESNNWSPEVYRFETEDVVLGGEDGLDNLPGKQLAGRTNWLRLMLTAVCAAEGVTVLDNETTQFLTAIDSRIGNAISALVDSSPAALDTLNELAAALGDDPNFAATMTTALGNKASWAVIDHVITAAGLGVDHATNSLLLDAITVLFGNSSIIPGTIIDWSGDTAPAGFMALPALPTNVSRATFSAVFAKIGTKWGAGDGSTTFGLPYCPSNYTTVAGNSGNVGTTTVGEVIAHTHAQDPLTAKATSGPYLLGSSSSAWNYGGTTGSTGGSANLAAGVRVLKCIKL